MLGVPVCRATPLLGLQVMWGSWLRGAIEKATRRVTPLLFPFLFCLFLLKICSCIFFPDAPTPPVTPPGIALLSLGTGGASRTIARPIKVSAEA
jgi:hypothetical protein